MDTYYDVVVTGGGASGLLCAGILAEKGFSVVVFEKNKKPGKKLSATGNGRCNFTNLNMNPSFFYGDHAWIDAVISRFSPEDVIKFFEEIGVYHRERDGYIYPYTNQAVTVVNALVHYCTLSGVSLVTDCKVRTVRPIRHAMQPGKRGGYFFPERYVVETSQGRVSCSFVVLATGGKAGAQQGGDGSGYKLAGSLGHTIYPVNPGLTGLKCKGSWWNKVAGTRIQGGFSLLTDDGCIPGECGEIQITRDGVSGIPVFQLCRVAAMALERGQSVRGKIDFVPPMSRQEVNAWLADHGVRGLVPEKWEPVFEKRKQPAESLKNFTFEITDTFGLERAQVSAGGVATGEVDAVTMESRIAPGIYLTGELLDVDGKCGGYNLHFAWSTAMAAGTAIGKWMP